LVVGDRVILELADFAGKAHIHVNEVDYGIFAEKEAPVRIDLKDNVAENNRLVIEVSDDVSDGPRTHGLTGMVYVTIFDRETLA
jgi:hypothetical protein